MLCITFANKVAVTPSRAATRIRESGSPTILRQCLILDRQADTQNLI
ncbi:MAG: hypothetical protein QNJ54_30980 [Prochloraceae cyanobacterium]|nr:hypothetical protein [Prochloraceae cyanobacterium]